MGAQTAERGKIGPPKGQSTRHFRCTLLTISECESSGSYVRTARTDHTHQGKLRVEQLPAELRHELLQILVWHGCGHDGGQHNRERCPQHQPKTAKLKVFLNRAPQKTPPSVLVPDSQCAVERNMSPLGVGRALSPSLRTRMYRGGQRHVRPRRDGRPITRPSTKMYGRLESYNYRVLVKRLGRSVYILLRYVSGN